MFEHPLSNNNKRSDINVIYCHMIVQEISFINFKRNYFDNSCFSHWSQCSVILQRKCAGRYLTSLCAVLRRLLIHRLVKIGPDNISSRKVGLSTAC